MAKDIVLILGITLVVLAIVGRIKTAHFEVGVRSKGKRSLLCVVGLALVVVFFSRDLRALYDSYLPPARMSVVVVDPVDTKSLGPTARYVGDKVHRNLAELLSNAGHSVVAPPLSVADMSSHHVLKRFAIKLISYGDNLTIQVALVSADGSPPASTELYGAASDFKELYKALPEAILFGLDLDERSLRSKRTSKRPTTSPEAYAYYVYARREHSAGDDIAAQVALEKAIALDRRFALAYWSLGTLMLSQKGKESEGQKLIDAAARIDPDHPKVALASQSHQSNPVPDLMAAVRRAREGSRELEPGFHFVKAASKHYGVEISIWSVDPKRFDVQLIEQLEIHGSKISDLLAGAGAVLAINGGFFETDADKRLSPAGVLVVDGVVRRAAANKQSGALVRDSAGVGIIWAKDLGDLSRYKFVVQAGPILVEGPGRLGIRANDYDRVNRTAVCTRGNTIVFVVVHGSQGNGLSLYQLAELLAAREADGGLGCELALNLDGGPSTQAAMNIGRKNDTVDGLWKIHNAVVVNEK